MQDFSRSNNPIAMEKYSISAVLAKEAVNTKITKLELEIEPALYKNAPITKTKKTKFLKNSSKQ